MKQNILFVLLMIVVGGLLTWGCFGLHWFPYKDVVNMGKRLREQETLFSNLRLSTELTPGEATITIKEGWIERKRLGFFVLGGMQSLVLNGVTIVTSLNKVSAASQPVRLSEILASIGKKTPFTLAKVYRFELRAPLEEGGQPFLRAESVQIPAAKESPIVLENAWFCEPGKTWERLDAAWMTVERDQHRAQLQMLRKGGVQLSLPLEVIF